MSSWTDQDLYSDDDDDVGTGNSTLTHRHAGHATTPATPDKLAVPDADQGAKQQQQRKWPSPFGSPKLSPMLKSLADKAHDLQERMEEAMPALHLPHSIQELKDDMRAIRLTAYKHLPAWVKDNPYLTHGYRVDIGWEKSARSMCHLHNETFNVWTHAAGFAVVLVLFVVTLLTLSPHGIDRMGLDVGLVNTRSSGSNTAGGCDDSASGLKAASVYAAHAWDEEIRPLFSSWRALLPGMDGDDATASTDSLSEETLALCALCCAGDEVGTQGCGAGDDICINNGKPTSCGDSKEERERLCAQCAGGNSNSNSNSDSKMLDAVNLVKARLPDLTKVTEALKRKAASLRDAVHDNNSRFHRYSQEKFVDYMHTVERAAHSLKDSLADISPDLSADQLEAKLERVRRRLVDQNLGGLGRALQKGDGGRLHLMEAASVIVDAYTSYATVQSRNGTREAVEQGHAGWLREFKLVLPETGAKGDDDDGRGLHPFLPVWPLALFMVSAMCCLLFSAVFHLFCAVSQEVSITLQSLDYAGICLLIAGSNVPLNYYGFYCYPNLRTLYMTAHVVCGSVGFAVSVLPYFRPLRFRTMRTVMWLVLGGIGVIPMGHMMALYGRVLPVGWWLLAMLSLYVCGALIYLTRVPEYFAPGYFNHFFSSHQLWHVAVFVAVLVHYLGMLRFYEWRITLLCPALP